MTFEPSKTEATLVRCDGCIAPSPHTAPVGFHQVVLRYVPVAAELKEGFASLALVPTGQIMADATDFDAELRAFVFQSEEPPFVLVCEHTCMTSICVCVCVCVYCD
jgi:hypothetical protein